MARLKYPGVPRKSSSSQEKRSNLTSKVTKRRKKKTDRLPSDNRKVITPKQYREIFGDSDEEDQEEFLGFSAKDLGLTVYPGQVLLSSRTTDGSKSGNFSLTTTTTTTSTQVGSWNPIKSYSSDSFTGTESKSNPPASEKSVYGREQICENIYAKTYKKRDPSTRRLSCFRNSDLLSSTIADKAETTGETTASSYQSNGEGQGPGLNRQVRRAVNVKSTKPLSIAKQLLEKAKGEKRLQLQRKGHKDSSSSPVSRFGRTLKKKVLEYDEFTSGSHKRPLEDGEVPPLKVFKSEEGARNTATATGDIAMRYLNYIKYKEWKRLRKNSPSNNTEIIVCDVNQAMLDVGKRKAEKLGVNKDILWVCGNGEQLPFEDNSFDIYTIAFGIRNFTHVDKALEEAHRVLVPGGRFMCLEFSDVTNSFISRLYDSYSFQVIPVMGQIIAKDWESYQYLVESIRQFPDQEEFAHMIRSSGFSRVNYENLTFGVAAIHSGFKL